MLFLELVKDFFTNPVMIIPICAWFIAQLLKVTIKLLVDKKFSLERMFGDGGMPSGHSATVMSLCVIIGWSAGLGSILFAISAVLAIIVMHDASGVRREAGKQANTIKQLAEIMNGMFLGKDEKIRTEKLKEFVGHTPMQVFFGALLGAFVSIIAIIIFKIPYAVAA